MFMEYILAGIRLSLPDSLIPPRFAEALRPFAAAGQELGRARAAGPEVAPEEAVARARAAGSEVAQEGAVGRARTTSSEVAQEEAAARARTTGSEVAPGTVAEGRDRSEPELVLNTVTTIHRAAGWHELHRFDFADADADCRFGRDKAGFLLEMAPRDHSRPVRFRMPEEGCRACCDFTPAHHPALFRFGVWILFNLTALHRGAVAIHASAIHYRGRGVLFLGESGTGKSTHTRLWRSCIPGTALLNDDSPILGIPDGTPRIWGSPWSGKLPCYRNESYPVAAIVRLVQAPENRIRRLAPVDAFGALLPSAPPAFLRDPRLQDAVCRLLGQVIEQVPLYRLECRPDTEAARLACETLFGAPPATTRNTPDNSVPTCR